MLPAALAGLATGWVASTLPFYPPGWPLGLAIAAATLGFAAPRAGLAFALASAFLPLANISLGLGIVFAVLAVGWLALSWNDARSGLLAAIGPLAGARSAAWRSIPLAAQVARGPVRRVAQAGRRRPARRTRRRASGGSPLPFAGTSAPLGLGIAGSNRPGAVARRALAALLAHPALLGGALVLGCAAAALPYLRHRGPWPAAAYGATFMLAAVVVAPGWPCFPWSAPPGSPRRRLRSNRLTRLVTGVPRFR